jgi:hypothetical protein
LEETEKRMEIDGVNERDKWKLLKVSKEEKRHIRWEGAASSPLHAPSFVPKFHPFFHSQVDVRPLYYHLLVDVGEPPNEWKS